MTAEPEWIPAGVGDFLPEQDPESEVWIKTGAGAGVEFSVFTGAG